VRSRWPTDFFIVMIIVIFGDEYKMFYLKYVCYLMNLNTEHRLKALIRVLVGIDGPETGGNRSVKQTT
jgi:hypothetical protein